MKGINHYDYTSNIQYYDKKCDGKTVDKYTLKNLNQGYLFTSELVE